MLELRVYLQQAVAQQVQEAVVEPLIKTMLVRQIQIKPHRKNVQLAQKKEKVPDNKNLRMQLHSRI